MPVPELMTWVPSQRRWTKMYKGRRYYISPRQLNTADTKEASLTAANQWWRDRQSELDYSRRASARTPAPMEDLAAASLGIAPDAFFGQLLALWNKWVNSGQIPQADARELAERDAKGIVQNVLRQLLEQSLIEGQPLPQGIAGQLPPSRAAQIERGIKELRGDCARRSRAHCENAR